MILYVLNYNTFMFKLDMQATGILRDQTMEGKLIYIPNDVKQYHPFCRLNFLVD